MSDPLQLEVDQYRLLVATQYLNASEAICKGLRCQRGVNDFHFLVTLRSFIESTRRGIWFLAWASEERLKEAGKLTFDRAGSPGLANMDAMINEALDEGKVSPLMRRMPGINEPFLNCLHALTHGNPISVRMITFGLDKIFDTGGLLAKVEVELDLLIFKVVLYRRMLGEDINAIWKVLAPIHDRPADVQANALDAANLLKESGKAAQSLGHQLP